MITWHGVLTTAPGKREEYVGKIKKAGLINKFLHHPGNIYYNIGLSVTNPDQLIVVDCWKDMASFTAHDTSADVDVWREIYAEYVVDCQSELYECTYAEN